MKSVLFLLLLFLSSWTSDQLQTINGIWTLVCYYETNTKVENCKPEESTNSITLEFVDNGEVGTIKGHTVSNQVYGNYELYGNNKMKVNSFGGTKIGEHGWGSNFQNTIYKTSSYKVKPDSLFIYYDNDSKIMEFIRTTIE